MIEHLSSLPLEQKVGQLFFIGIDGPELDSPTVELLSEITPGGVCLFARNIRDRIQTRELLDGVNDQLTAPLLSVDQEGGLVDRLRRVLTPMPAAGSIRDADGAARLGSIVGEALRILGFNMDFAPVVDVIDEQRAKHSNGLFSRTFGRSAKEATEYARLFLIELQQHQISGCIKHFPGLGASEVDSHEELPLVPISEAEFDAIDMVPYRELLSKCDVRAVMAAHAGFLNLSLQEMDQNGKLLPSSLSYSFITTLLREQLAYDGLVITDDLEMGAIVQNYGIGDACKMAVAAGADMLAICADPEAVRLGYYAVLDAVRSQEISIERLDRSLARVARIKAKIAAPPPFDNDRLDTLSAEIAALIERSGPR